LIVLLFALLGGGLWVAITLLVVGYVAISMFSGATPGFVLATTIWGQSNNWALTALPMFIWMGEILYRTRVSDDMFRGLAPWVSRIPGRLMHVNVFASGIFAAISGSSTATAATIGKISLPELEKRGYDQRLAYGSLASAGTLGILVPPSIAMIIYGFLTDVSVARLFVAGVLPSLLLVGLFSGYIAVWSLLNPGKVPKRDLRFSFKEKLYESRRLIPVVILIIAVLGSIYQGIATPSEAAVVGVVGSLLISAAYRSLSWKNFVASVYGAMITSTMLLFILAASSVLNVAMGYSGLPRDLATWIGGMNLSQYELLAVLAVLFILMGMFIDGISILVLTAAIIIPIVEQAGIDLLWFGVYLVIVIEIGLITPPVGFNLFVIQGITKRDIVFISRGAVPFFLLMIVAVGILMIFPEIATFLPSKVR
jgi:tripartite ATP-independent transporter DctM subunit